MTLAPTNGRQALSRQNSLKKKKKNENPFPSVGDRFWLYVWSSLWPQAVLSKHADVCGKKNIAFYAPQRKAL